MKLCGTLSAAGIPVEGGTLGLTPQAGAPTSWGYTRVQGRETRRGYPDCARKRSPYAEAGVFRTISSSNA